MIDLISIAYGIKSKVLSSHRHQKTTQQAGRQADRHHRIPVLAVDYV